jgi:uncharacterized membrane protein YcaP (DUF421 family)
MALEELLLPENPIYELVIRGIVIYFALMIAFRLIGKHEFGQMSPFDLILLLIISESISCALNVNDNSLTAGLIVMSTLIVLNYLMSEAQFRSKTLKRILSGEAEVLIRDGEPEQRLMKKERITEDDIVSSLREKGIDGMDRVRLGYLEDDGKISALLRDEPTSEQRQAAREAEDRAAGGGH